MTEREMNSLAEKIVDRLMFSPRGQRIIKEIALSVIVAREHAQEHGIVCTFLSLAEAAGCRFWMGEDGMVKCENKSHITEYMKAVYAVWGEPIRRYLTRLRDQKAAEVKPPVPNGQSTAARTK